MTSARPKVKRKTLRETIVLPTTQQIPRLFLVCVWKFWGSKGRGEGLGEQGVAMSSMPMVHSSPPWLIGAPTAAFSHQTTVVRYSANKSILEGSPTVCVLGLLFNGEVSRTDISTEGNTGISAPISTCDKLLKGTRSHVPKFYLPLMSLAEYAPWN